MKINALTQAIQFQEHRRDEQGQKKREKKDSRKDEQSRGEFQASLEEIAHAAEEFKSENSNLEASVSGQGFGLRVTLKDGSGAVVRQMTGEEFMRLREEAQKGRGKILDQKF